MADITEAELKTEVEKILENADLAKTSQKKVREQLEKNLGKDLSEHRKVIDKLIIDYVDSKPDSCDEEDQDLSEEEQDSIEEEVKKPVKRQAPTKAAKKRQPSSDEASNNSDSEEEEVKKPVKRQAPTKAAKKRQPSSDEASNNSDSEEEKKPSPKKKGRKKNTDSDSDWGKKGKGAGKKSGGRKGGGYTRAYRLSEPLAALMGKDEMARHEVVRAVWALIKEKDLYDHNNRQFAICDDALYKVIGTKRFRIFGMMKYLKTHFLED